MYDCLLSEYRRLHIFHENRLSCMGWAVFLYLISSAEEHLAFNRGAMGSNPIWGIHTELSGEKEEQTNAGD